MVGTYTPSIAPLEAPVSDCGMETSTAGRNEVWRRGVVGGRYNALPKLVTQKLRLDRERAQGFASLSESANSTIDTTSRRSYSRGSACGKV